MTQNQAPSPDPDPAVTAGVDAGGSTASGDTSPAADSMSGTTGGTASDGPVSGNRTPMIIALSALAIVVLLVAGFIVASLVAS